MSQAAISFDCKTLEKDPTPAALLTVDCPRCDPDSPLAVPRESCEACQGSGQAPVALASIVTEIHESRMELLRGGKSARDENSDDEDDGGEDEIYDGWCDPDDLC